MRFAHCCSRDERTRRLIPKEREGLADVDVPIAEVHAHAMRGDIAGANEIAWVVEVSSGPRDPKRRYYLAESHRLHREP